MAETPYYLIDERRLQHNLEIVREVRERSGAKSVLALKCFSTWGVFPLLSQYLDGTTSSSAYEARLGHERFGGETHAYSVAYDPREIREVAAFADKVIFNSASQLEAFRDVVLDTSAGRASIGVRVNPGVSTSHFDLADPARRFSRLGVGDLDELARVAPSVDGFMFHFNCENDDLDLLTHSLDAIADRYGALLRGVDWVSLGGGISFTAPGYPLDRFAETLRSFADRHGVQVYLEPGEAVVTGAAELVTTVLDVVHNEVDVAVVDASVEAHFLDHLIYRTHPRVASPPAGSHRVMVAGRTCLAGDVFGDYHLDAPLAVGDEVRFADAAGYTMVKTTWFNGLRMPSIVVRRLDGTVETVRRFDYDDFVRSLS
jgi:carboxynorspermidine decarboxylase